MRGKKVGKNNIQIDDYKFFRSDKIPLHKLKKPNESLLAQSVKNLPAMQETQVQSLGWEDPLEKEMATHSSIFAWRILWTEEPGGLKSMGLQESDMT